MAKIEPWEHKIRQQAKEFARRLNYAPTLAHMTHEQARVKGGDRIPVVYPDEPDWTSKLVGCARKIADVAAAITMAIEADEGENDEVLGDAMKVLADFTEGLSVTLRWVRKFEDYALSREQTAEEEDHPLIATGMMLGFADYWQRDKDIVHLGVCRQCLNVYVKPKHGRKMRYCSRACQQKAYRKRRKEKGS